MDGQFPLTLANPMGTSRGNKQNKPLPLSCFFTRADHCIEADGVGTNFQVWHHLQKFQGTLPLGTLLKWALSQVAMQFITIVLSPQNTWEQKQKPVASPTLPYWPLNPRQNPPIHQQPKELINALKLMVSGVILDWRITSNISSAHCHSAPFWQELMAALKVKRSGRTSSGSTSISISICKTCCHCPAFSRQEIVEL